MLNTSLSSLRIPGRREKGRINLTRFFLWLLAYGPYILNGSVTLALLSSLFLVFVANHPDNLSAFLNFTLCAFIVLAGTLYGTFLIRLERFNESLELIREEALIPKPKFWRSILLSPFMKILRLPELAIIVTIAFFALVIVLSGVDFVSLAGLFWPLIVLQIAYASYRYLTEQVWVLCSFVLGSIIILFVKFQSNVLPLSTSNIISYVTWLGVYVFWAMSFWGLLHYIFRQISFADQRIEAVRKIAIWVREHPAQVRDLVTPSTTYHYEFWQKLAETASHELTPGVFSILVYDPAERKVFLRASYSSEYPLERNIWQDQSWAVDEGITGWVIRAKRSFLCPDVTWCPQIFKPLRGFKTCSEVAVPIVVRDQVRGVLDIQSPKTFSLDAGTRAALEGMAEAFAAVLSQADLVERENKSNYDLIQQVTKSLKDCKGVGETLKAIAQQTCQAYGATNVIIYRLSPGLAYPLVPPQYAGKIKYPEYLKKAINNKSILHRLIEDWESIFSTDDPRLRRQSSSSEKTEPNPASFVEREGIRATAFMLLGTSEHKIAVMFVNYDHPRAFPQQFQIAMRALVDAVSMILLLRQDSEAAWRAREVKKSIDHSGTRKCFSNVRSMLKLAEGDHVRQGSGNAMGQLSSLLDPLRQNVDALEKQITNLWASTETFSDFNMEFQLRDALKTLREDKWVDEWLDLSVDSRIEDEPYEARAELYSLTVEAVNNAVLRGKAPKVRVRLQRWPWKLNLVVIDNGSGFNQNKPYGDPFDPDYSPPSSTGIYRRLQLSRTGFDAEGKIRSRQYVGTVVQVSLPTRPKEL